MSYTPGLKNNWKTVETNMAREKPQVLFYPDFNEKWVEPVVGKRAEVWALDHSFLGNSYCLTSAVESVLRGSDGKVSSFETQNSVFIATNSPKPDTSNGYFRKQGQDEQCLVCGMVMWGLEHRLSRHRHDCPVPQIQIDQMNEEQAKANRGPGQG